MKALSLEMMRTGELQWGSETGSRRRSPALGQRPRRPRASMGLRDWVSEKGRWPRQLERPGCRFNGAPRLGLGEGSNNASEVVSVHLRLQWGSETGSRRRSG